MLMIAWYDSKEKRKEKRMQKDGSSILVSVSVKQIGSTFQEWLYFGNGWSFAKLDLGFTVYRILTIKQTLKLL